MDILLQEFGVKNFKCIKDELKCELKKYTFLFGPNGAGKSTFLQSILLLQQNIIKTKSSISYNDDIEFFLSFGKLKETKNAHGLIINVDLLGKDNDLILFNSDLFDEPNKLNVSLRYVKNILGGWSINDLTSGFSFNFEYGEEDEYGFPNGKNVVKINLGSFKQNFEVEKIESDKLKSLISFYDEEKQRLNNLLSFVFQYTEDIRSILDEGGSTGFENEVFYANDGLILKFKKEILEHYQDLIHKYNFNEEIIFSDENNFLNINNLISFAEDIVSPYYNYIRKLLLNNFAKISHVGHIRSEFPRAFIKNDSKNTFQENSIIEDLVEIWKRSDPEFHPEIQKILKELEFGDDFKIDDSLQGVYQAFVLQGKNYVNFSDMSSGFKQTVPLLLKLLRHYNATILVEQPELHLHPKLQAKLMEVLVKYNDEYRENKFIIETHSEHMIRKVQVMIAKGDLDKDDVVVYYFDNKDGTTRKKEMEIEDTGFFKRTLATWIF